MGQVSPCFCNDSISFCYICSSEAKATWERVILDMQSPLELSFQPKSLLFEAKLRTSQPAPSGRWEFWRTLAHISRINNTEIRLFCFSLFLWWFACWLPVRFLETVLSPLLPEPKQHQFPRQKLRSRAGVRARNGGQQRQPYACCLSQQSRQDEHFFPYFILGVGWLCHQGNWKTRDILISIL